MSETAAQGGAFALPNNADKFLKPTTAWTSDHDRRLILVRRSRQRVYLHIYTAPAHSFYCS